MEFAEVRALIRSASQSGIKLWVADNRLHYKAIDAEMPAGLHTGLCVHHDAIVAELTRPAFRHGYSNTSLQKVTTYSDAWWHETNCAPAAANVMHLVAKMSGHCSLSRVEDAVRAAFSRHELLRARVELIDGTAYLRFNQSPAIRLDIQELDAPDPEAAQMQARVLAQQLVWTPFESGQLFRSFIIRVSSRMHLVGFVFHHFVGDFYSCRLLTRDLFANLRGHTQHTAPPANGALQFSDYLSAVGAWLEGPALPHRLSYWQRQLQSAPTVRLPGGSELAQATVGPIHSVSFQIDVPLRARLARIAAQSGVTLSIVILAAKFATLLDILRLTDLVVVALVSGRDHPSLLNMVGNTVNCLPLRISVRPEMTFTKLIATVDETYRLACNYQVPWGLLLQTLAQCGVSGVAPSVNLLPGGYFNKRGASTSVEENGLLIEGVAIEKPAALGTAGWYSSHEMHLFDSGQALFGIVKYAALRYQPQVIEGFTTLFRGYLQRIAADVSSTMDSSAP
jgi:hypothetical protein